MIDAIKHADGPLIFSNEEGLTERVRPWIEKVHNRRDSCFVFVHRNAGPHIPTQFGFPVDRRKEFSPVRALVVFVGLPVKFDSIGAWQNWFMEKGVWDLKMGFLATLEEDALTALITENCTSWSTESVEPEDPALTLGSYVEMPTGRRTEKDDPSLLTMMFGSMGDLMTELHLIARTFRNACPVDNRKKAGFLENLDHLLAGESINKHAGVLEFPRTDLPRVLLYGETGVGKTLVTRFLHQNCGFSGRPLRVAIPEYLGKEDMFEYDLFGFMKGAYTDAHQGSRGLLLENVGGVVFLDEIGEANSLIQSKLLAFLDDYRVRPRKWGGDPFHCPLLVVAATNRDLPLMVKEGTFRKDLFARFSDQHTIPPLRARKSDFHFILDCLLHRRSINPESRVQHIGSKAMDALLAHDYTAGNFREMEEIVRQACRSAIRDGRDIIVEHDVRI